MSFDTGHFQMFSGNELQDVINFTYKSVLKRLILNCTLRQLHLAFLSTIGKEGPIELMRFVIEIKKSDNCRNVIAH